MPCVGEKTIMVREPGNKLDHYATASFTPCLAVVNTNCDMST